MRVSSSACAAAPHNPASASEATANLRAMHPAENFVTAVARIDSDIAFPPRLIGMACCTETNRVAPACGRRHRKTGTLRACDASVGEKGEKSRSLGNYFYYGYR